MEKYDAVIKELAALLVPHLIAHPDMQKFAAGGGLLSSWIHDAIQVHMDELGLIDKDMIREVCEEVLDASHMDDKISDYMCHNFDISDYESEIKDMVDIDDALEDKLPDAVHQCVQNLKFTVEVESR